MSGRNVTLRDVTLRDGLQLVTAFLPTERKAALCKGLAAAGFSEIELTSFVPASVIAQFSDARQLAALCADVPGVTISALTPNLKGAIFALENDVPQINFVLSASEAHNLANVRKSTQSSLADFQAIAAEIRTRIGARKVRLSAGIATSFGCTIQGEVDQERVVELAKLLAEAGADELLIADTVGYANPVQVARLLRAVRDAVGSVDIIGHFHDTRGLGLANIAAALDAGIRRFDVSLGGLGGCPFAPGASGNVNAEDCIHMLESMGIATSIDLAAPASLRRELEAWLSGGQDFPKHSPRLCKGCRPAEHSLDRPWPSDRAA